MDLNSPNVFYNPKLFNASRDGRDEAETTRSVDQMFLGLNLNPGLTGCDLSNPSAVCGPVNGTTQDGIPASSVEFHLQNGSG